MDCAAFRLVLRVILLRKIHQLATLGSNGVQILSPFSVRYKKPRLRGAFHIWRRGRDSNPRYGLSRTLTFQASPFDHSGTSPKTYLICIVRC